MVNLAVLCWCFIVTVLVESAYKYGRFWQRLPKCSFAVIRD